MNRRIYQSTEYTNPQAYVFLYLPIFLNLYNLTELFSLEMSNNYTSITYFTYSLPFLSETSIGQIKEIDIMKKGRAVSISRAVSNSFVLKLSYKEIGCSAQGCAIAKTFKVHKSNYLQSCFFCTFKSLLK